MTARKSVISKRYALHQGSFQKALSHLAPRSVNLWNTSPPYNIGSKGPRNDKMRNTADKHYASKSYGAITGYPDSLPEDIYQNQQAQVLLWMAELLAPGGTIVYNHKPRQKSKTIIDPHEWLLRPDVHDVLVEATYPIVWNRGSTHNCGRGLLWQNSERLYILRRADDTSWSMNNHGSRGLERAFQRDVWNIPLSSRPAGGHAAPFPVTLAESVIKMWSEPDDLVGDPYTGSGTTGVAALSLNRRFVGAELLPKYYQLSAERLAATNNSEEEITALFKQTS